MALIQAFRPNWWRREAKKITAEKDKSLDHLFALSAAVRNFWLGPVFGGFCHFRCNSWICTVAVGAAVMGSLSGCGNTQTSQDLSPMASLLDSGSTPPNEMSDGKVPRAKVRSNALPKGGGVYKVGMPYQVGGRMWVPREQPQYDEEGLASWYGKSFHGAPTANGEIYDAYALTGAHKTLPLPSYATVTNLENKRKILVRINDRGPFKPGRIIDLSDRAAQELGFRYRGLVKVRVTYVGRAPLNGDDSRETAFLEQQSWSRRAQN